MAEGPIVSIRSLEITFRLGERRIRAVRGIDLDIARGSIHALVGESGSGKSVTARSILGLLPREQTEISAERIAFDGRELHGLDESRFREVRGSGISMIFQDPGKHLNPSLKVGRQLTEMISIHTRSSRREALTRARELADLVGLAGEDRGRRVLGSYPHELSGGMNQRLMIAMALSCDPKLLIADEPATALDVTVGRQILDLIRGLNRRLGMAVLFISHDLAVVHEIADHVSVIYAGRIVESAPQNELFADPIHPYTKLLLASVPDPARRGSRLEAIPGKVPDAEAVPPGCAFHPRCPFAEAVCEEQMPELRDFAGSHRVACHLAGTRDLALPGTGGAR